jgi:hydrogenase nickel incorporation protein HypB
MILSVPEGDDKPLKYPLMFTVSDLLIINKIDTLGVFDFDIAQAERRVKALNPNIEVIRVSAKTGEGIDRIAAWIARERISTRSRA